MSHEGLIPARLRALVVDLKAPATDKAPATPEVRLTPHVLFAFPLRGRRASVRLCT